MIAALVTAFALAQGATGAAPAPADTAVRRALLAVFGGGPVLPTQMCTASSPIAAVYDDGTIIYVAKCSESGPQYVEARLAPGELRDLLGTLPLGSFLRLDSLWYDNLPNWTDMPVYSVWVASGDSGKCVHLYGALDSTLAPDAPVDPVRHAAPAPGPFVRIYNVLSHITDTRATAWLPDRFDLVFSDSGVGWGSKPAWPETWPSHLTRSARRDRWRRYHVELTLGGDHEVLEALKGRSIDYRQYTLRGEFWFVHVDYIFPGQERWAACSEF